MTDPVVTDPVAMSDLDLAALMCSKLCHDVISPVGAVTNGFEVLEDEKDESMREMALDIIRNNAAKASARLQFLRLAFGAMGGAGDRFPVEEARKLTENLYAGEKAVIDWKAPPDSLPKDQVKLLVNLVVLAVSMIPRGGTVTVNVIREGAGGAIISDSEEVSFRISATGSHAVLSDTTRTIFDGVLPEEGLDARSVQSYYAHRLAKSLDMPVSFEVDADTIRIAADKT
ncbi:histidine phosphotransferase family protein [Microbaculum sp. FT89]|uniref:histidine phosphotransferase family protein n=1 Tax=Microbaculum sp. FT89 TaxID=3447298 RepID=UPI003F5310B6